MRSIALAFLLVLGVASAASAAPLAITNPGFEDLYFGSNLPAQYAGNVPPGAFPFGPPPAGWTAYYEGGSPFAGLSIGVINPGTQADYGPDPAAFPAGAPEAENAVLLYMDGDAGGNEFGVVQQLAATLAANTRYTLSVEVGNIASGSALVQPFLGFGFFNLAGFPGYRLQLLAAGQVIAEDTGSILPGEGVFQRASLQLTTGDAPPQLGQALGIRLVNRNEADVPGVRGLEVDFDDVQLDAAPALPAVPLSASTAWLLALTLLASGFWIARARRVSGLLRS